MKLDDDDFTLLGVPTRFALDRAELDTRWRAVQAQVHPDKFAAEGAAAQRVAMQWAVRVNEAHQRLKDPLSRAAYLCELRGAAIDADRNTAMPGAFLVQQLEWREALAEATGEAAVQALDDEVARYEKSLFVELGSLLDEQGNATEAAQRVRALMFVRRFREDVDRRLEAFQA